MNEQFLTELYEKVSATEARAKRRIFIISIATIAVGIAWVAIVSQRVQNLQAQAIAYQGIIEQDKQRIEQLEAKLQTISTFTDDAVDLRWEDVKMVMSTHYQAGIILQEILELKNRKAKFVANARTPEEGFNSPGMMRYVLEKTGVIQSGQYETSNEAIARQLANKRVEISSPSGLRSGDIVVYSAGYFMLYADFVQPYGPHTGERKQFSVGMTPFGIQAVVPDFNTIQAVYRLESH
jgi:hypothetical protein